MDPSTLIIFHRSCADGYTSAWVVANHGHTRGLGPHYQLLSAQYGDSPPAREEVEDRDVVIVDFSYKHDELVEIAEHAKSLIVLDHHKTAADEVKALDFVTFDNDRSGAMLAWDHFVTETVEQDDPDDVIGADLVRYVQDRDLWTWELPDSKAVSAALTLVPMKLGAWTDFARRMSYEEGKKAVIKQGRTIQDFQNLWAEQKAKQAITRTIRGHEVPVVNLAVKLQSEVGHTLCDDPENPVPFAASFFMTQDEDGDEVAIFSLRSTDAGEDVGAIAKTFEHKGRTGGGHRNAAGFSVPLSALFEGLK